jgi:hypothetical protein
MRNSIYLLKATPGPIRYKIVDKTDNKRVFNKSFGSKSAASAYLNERIKRALFMTNFDDLDKKSQKSVLKRLGEEFFRLEVET